MPSGIGRASRHLRDTDNGGRYAYAKQARCGDSGGGSARRRCGARDGSEIRRHAADRDARCASQHRPLLQQSAHRRGDAPSGLGRAGLSQSGYLQARAAARHRVEVAGPDHDRVHAAARREIPRRQPVHGRRRGLHHQSRSPIRRAAVDAVELQLDRQGGEDRRSFGARQAEAAESGGAGIFRAGVSRSIPRPIARRSARKATPRRRSARALTR